MSLLGLALAVLVGVSLGFFGGGGSILTVPLLVYVFGQEPKQAIAGSLLIVGIASLSAAIQHWRLGNVRLAQGAVFGAAGMVGAHAGGRAGAFIDGGLLLMLFAAMMCITSLAMWRGRRPVQRPDSRARSRIKLAAQGVAVGTFTGLVGAGGGFLIVPALTLWAGLPMPAAIGTSLFVIVGNSAAGFAGYASHVRVDGHVVAAVASAAVAGSFVGSRLAHRVDPASLRRTFAGFVLAMAVLILAREAPLVVDTASAALPATAPQLLFALLMLAVGVLAGRASLGGKAAASPEDSSSAKEKEYESDAWPAAGGREAMTGFTPASAVLGGILIGFAAALLLLGLGRIAGISGILGRFLFDGGRQSWQLAFLLGLPLGAASVALVQGGLPVRIDASAGSLVLAGLLVGFGSRLGSGCTSGHGVCGMARGSRRSIAATLTFMATGIFTAWLTSPS